MNLATEPSEELRYLFFNVTRLLLAKGVSIRFYPVYCLDVPETLHGVSHSVHRIQKKAA
jgi:hypothetical protein